MSSLFSKIVAGKVPAHFVAKSKDYVAFLDINPLHEGHTLVVPKQEIDYIFDQSKDILSGLLPFAQKVAKAIEQVVLCKRIGLAVLGLEIPHTHLHLVPIHSLSDLDFAKPRVSCTQAQFSDLAARIREIVERDTT